MSDNASENLSAAADTSPPGLASVRGASTPPPIQRYGPVTPHSIRARRRLTPARRISRAPIDPFGALRALSRVLANADELQESSKGIGAATNTSAQAEESYPITDDDANQIANATIDTIENDVSGTSRDEISEYESIVGHVSLETMRPSDASEVSDLPRKPSPDLDMNLDLYSSTDSVKSSKDELESPERFRSRRDTYVSSLGNVSSSVMFRNITLRSDDFSDDWVQRHQMSEGSIRFEISDSLMSSEQAVSDNSEIDDRMTDKVGGGNDDDDSDHESGHESDHESDHDDGPAFHDGGDEQQLSDRPSISDVERDDTEPELHQKPQNIVVPRPINIGDDSVFVEPTMSASDVRMQNLLKPRRTRRSFKVETAVPKKNIRDIIKMVSSSKIPADALDEIITVSDAFFQQSMDSLVKYADRGKRKTIESQDVVRLMKHQKVVNSTRTPFALAHKYLPAELLEAIISETN